MAIDTTAPPLAANLDELHQRFEFDGHVIVNYVRERLGLSKDVSEPEIFRNAFRAYNDGSADPELDAFNAYNVFLQSNGTEVPLKVARCLLPGSIH